MTDQLTHNWQTRLQTQQKEAAAMTRDDQEVAEAFAQQAYTAVGNRAKEILKDPHLLGFEVLDSNEDNSRLLGSFAFRVSGEILLIPVFFLNGQVKGYQLLYRKGVKRFCPNTENWISYLLSQGEDDSGRAIHEGVREGRLNLPLSRISGKMASAKDIPSQVQQIFKEANITYDPDNHELWMEQIREFEKQANVIRGVFGAAKGPQAPSAYAAAKNLKDLYGAATESARVTGAAAQASSKAPGLVPQLVKNHPWWTAAGVTGVTTPAVGAYAYSKHDVGKARENLAEAKATHAKLETAAAEAAEAAAAAKTAPAAEEDEGMGELIKGLPTHYWNAFKGLNPYAQAGIALGIPATAIGGMLWNESRKKKDKDKKSSEKVLPDLTANAPLIRELWKEAMAEWQVEEPQHLFADFIADSGMNKEAAVLATRLPEFAEWIEMSEALKHLTLTKKAAEPVVECWTDVPPPDATESQVERFYAQGYLLTDKRAADEKRVRVCDTSVTTRSCTQPGFYKALGWDENVRIAVAPDCCGFEDIPEAPQQGMAVVELDDKNRVVGIESISGYRLNQGATAKVNLLPVSCGEDCEKPESKKPVKGKCYVFWTPGGFVGGTYGTKCEALSKTDDGWQMNFEPKAYAKRVVLREDLEESSVKDGLVILGQDAVVLEIKDKDESLCDSGRKSWVAGADLQEVLLSDRVNVKVANVRGLFDLTINNKLVGRELPSHKLAMHLVGRTKLDGDQAMEIVKEAQGGSMTFICSQTKALLKESSSYFERDIDFDQEFDEEQIDPDFMIRQLPAHQRSRVVAIRHQRPSPERRWMDAHGNSGTRNVDHIPDEVIMAMTDPARQMAEAGQNLGLKTLIDHGAVSALTKVFDAGPFIIKYVDELEVSLDYLARLIFMMLWKPKDFSKMFGDDDLANLENKLLGTFESSGDVILELLQSTGDKGKL